MSARRIRRIFGATLLSGAVAFSAALAAAQEHDTTTGHAPTGHSPTTGAPTDPGHPPPGTGEHADAHGAQSGAHRSTPGHAAGHHGPEAINWTDIWDTKRPAVLALVINFGILMTAYYMLGKKPISEALKQRRVTIGKDIDEAQALLDEAKERAKKYQAELNTADADAATAKAALISAGKGEVDRILLEAQERADRMKRDADRLVEQERKQVHLDLLKETVDLAVQQAAQLLEKSVTADDHARLAQDLLNELARRPAAPKKVPPAAGSVRPTSSSIGPSGGAS